MPDYRPAWLHLWANILSDITQSADFWAIMQYLNLRWLHFAFAIEVLCSRGMAWSQKIFLCTYWMKRLQICPFLYIILYMGCVFKASSKNTLRALQNVTSEWSLLSWKCVADEVAPEGMYRSQGDIKCKATNGEKAASTKQFIIHPFNLMVFNFKWDMP